jgi:hypothetical protein
MFVGTYGTPRQKFVLTVVLINRKLCMEMQTSLPIRFLIPRTLRFRSFNKKLKATVWSNLVDLPLFGTVLVPQ